MDSPGAVIIDASIWIDLNRGGITSEALKLNLVFKTRSHYHAPFIVCAQFVSWFPVGFPEPGNLDSTLAVKACCGVERGQIALVLSARV